MSLSLPQPTGIYEDGGHHMKPFVTAVAIFVVSVVVCLLVAGLPGGAG